MPLRARSSLTRAFAALALASRLGAAAPQISSDFPPPQDLRAPDRTLPGAAEGPVLAGAYDPAGRTFAAGGGDGAIRVWDARTGEQGDGRLVASMGGKTQIGGQPESVRALAFRDAATLVSFADDRVVRAWKASSGEALSAVPLEGEGAVLDAAFSPGAEPLLGVAAGARIRLWDFSSGRAVAELSELGAPARRLAFSADGRVLAASSAEGAVRIWELPSRASRALAAPGEPALALAVGGGYAAVGRADGGIDWLPLGVGAPRHFSAGAGPVDAVAFSPKGDQFAAGGSAAAAKVWDVATGRLLCVEMGHAAGVGLIAFNPNGQKMAVGAADGGVDYFTVPLPPLSEAELARIDAAMPARATAAPRRPRRLLVFWRADAILHKGGVPAGNHAIEQMGRRTGAFSADFSRDFEALSPEVLANYDALVMNSTAHIVIPDAAKRAYLEFAARGGGVIGIHAAIDMFSRWPEGAAVIGATFANHPWSPTGAWAVKLEEPDHPLLRAFGGRNFRMHDEFYEMGDPYTRADRRVLLTVDLSDPTTAGVKGLHRKDRDFALSWIKRYGKGRVFYCDFGHLSDPFQDPAVLRYYLDGIQYALGDLDVDDRPRP